MIAAGFEGGRPKRREEAPLRRPVTAQKVQTQEETLAAAKALAEERRSDGAAQKAPVPVGVAAKPRGNADFDDDLDGFASSDDIEAYLGDDLIYGF